MFFFYCSRHRRHLHSFPTRRSSDLLRRVLIANPKVLAAWEDLTPLARNEWICWVLLPKKAETRSQHIQRVQIRAVRSEEHTSELQSRPHLVCRLLLEKKKRYLKYKS